MDSLVNPLPLIHNKLQHKQASKEESKERGDKSDAAMWSVCLSVLFMCVYVTSKNMAPHPLFPLCMLTQTAALFPGSPQQHHLLVLVPC